MTNRVRNDHLRQINCEYERPAMNINPPVSTVLAGCRRMLAIVAVAGMLLPLLASAEGTWQQVNANNAPPGIGTMLLLSDGTVMAQGGNSRAGATATWYKLTPGATGGYTNGQWTSLNSMNYTRDYYSSDVLPNGDVFVAGAEYGNGTTNAEIYDPVANSWTIVPIPAGIITENNTTNSGGGNKKGFIDSGSVVLNNGKVLVLPVAPATNGYDALYDPVANNWITTARQIYGSDEDEASTVKLPDDSILLIDFDLQTSERYIPSSNTWINDTAVPDLLYDIYGLEEGPAFLLPNGKAFFIGSTPVTAIYTPSGNTSPGSWVDGPPIPSNLGAPDAPAAMMNNGKILCAFSPSPYVLNGTNQIFTTPTYFYEYDYSAGSIGAFNQVHAPNGSFTNNSATFTCRMLDLPDGTVLFTDGNNLYVYRPDGSPLAAGRPAISSISWNTDGSLHLTGTLFNGISQGADYGDDAQMDSNYPLVRFTDGTGKVTYGRTYNWSSTSVQTGGEIVTTECAVPANVYDSPGTYSLQVVANGNASAAVSFYSPVWVNFNYSGTQAGTFQNPYSTLAQGVSAVANGGTVGIISSTQPSHSTAATALTKPMQIISVYGPATIGN